jgi:hypothetical protein
MLSSLIFLVEIQPILASFEIIVCNVSNAAPPTIHVTWISHMGNDLDQSQNDSVFRHLKH